MIVIIGADKDFTSTLSEHIKRELGFDCREVEDIEKAKNFMDETEAVIADKEIKGLPVPVITVDRQKPLRLRELLKSVKAAVEKTASAAPVAFGKGYQFSSRQKQLSHARTGKSVDLTDKEAQLLQLMIEAGTKGMDKEELLKTVWGFEPNMNTHTLETHIYRLRSKFKDVSDNEMIEAFEGGYRLAA